MDTSLDCAKISQNFYVLLKMTPFGASWLNSGYEFISFSQAEGAHAQAGVPNPGLTEKFEILP